MRECRRKGLLLPARSRAARLCLPHLRRLPLAALRSLLARAPLFGCRLLLCLLYWLDGGISSAILPGLPPLLGGGVCRGRRSLCLLAARCLRRGGLILPAILRLLRLLRSDGLMMLLPAPPRLRSDFAFCCPLRCASEAADARAAFFCPCGGTASFCAVCAGAGRSSSALC